MRKIYVRYCGRDSGAGPPLVTFSYFYHVHGGLGLSGSPHSHATFG